MTTPLLLGVPYPKVQASAVLELRLPVGALFTRLRVICFWLTYWSIKRAVFVQVICRLSEDLTLGLFFRLPPDFVRFDFVLFSWFLQTLYAVHYHFLVAFFRVSLCLIASFRFSIPFGDLRISWDKIMRPKPVRCIRGNSRDFGDRLRSDSLCKFYLSSS